jgi:hypothetical protein
MKGRNVILLLLCLLLLVLPLLCTAHIVEHGCTMCGNDAGEPVNYPADPCRTLVRVEELGELPPPLIALVIALDWIALTPVFEDRIALQDRDGRVAWIRNESVLPVLVYPSSDTPLRI